MALLLLLSTITWTIDKHLCMGRVMDVALFTKAHDCGMKAAIALLEEEGIENHCCDDETIAITGQEDLKLSWDNFNIEQQSFVTLFAYSYVYLFQATPKEVQVNKIHPPPILIYDIQLLDQVFLI